MLECNYFNWFSGYEIKENDGLIMKNEEMDVIVLEMEEMDGQRMKIVNLEKSVFISENRVTVLIWGVCFVCVLNIILYSVLMKNP